VPALPVVADATGVEIAAASGRNDVLVVAPSTRNDLGCAGRRYGLPSFRNIVALRAGQPRHHDRYHARGRLPALRRNGARRWRYRHAPGGHYGSSQAILGALVARQLKTGVSAHHDHLTTIERPKAAGRMRQATTRQLSRRSARKSSLAIAWQDTSGNRANVFQGAHSPSKRLKPTTRHQCAANYLLYWAARCGDQRSLVLIR
jgi:hypothetical protein